MSKTIPGKCSWCGAKKDNRYGQCPTCHRFPSQRDLDKYDKEVDAANKQRGKVRAWWNQEK